MSAGRWTLSDHAKQRRREMRVTEHAVEATLEAPEFDTPDPWPGRRRAFGPVLVVVYEPRTLRVVTVLWRSETPYARP